MSDLDRINRLRGYFHTGEFPVSTQHCLGADTLSALVDGQVESEVRARALAHLAGCVFCRRAVASVATALVHEPITHEIEVLEAEQ
jgi:hypothetical protein